MSHYWKNKRVFVTGCTGILGSWLTIRLVEEGAEVVGLIRDLVPKSNLNWSGFHNQINIVRGSVTEYEVIERAFNEYEVDTCFHLAAQTIVGIANNSPLSTFESNIKGTWTLLEAARRVGRLERIVIASTDKAYGDQDILPYTEEAPLKGLYPYDVSKSCADLLAQSYAHTYQLPIGITRCGNLYGGGDLNFNRIIPGTIRSVVMDENPVIRSDGSPIRDYFYVKDAVDAYLILAQSLDRNEVRGQAFNFSSETPVSALNIVSQIIAISGKNHLKPNILGKKLEGEIIHQFLSSQKARDLLSWKPRYSLEEGLTESIQWYKNFFKSCNKQGES
jgi:CDP-glucose 4,6-dehydratase